MQVEAKKCLVNGKVVGVDFIFRDEARYLFSIGFSDSKDCNLVKKAIKQAGIPLNIDEKHGNVFKKSCNGICFVEEDYVSATILSTESDLAADLESLLSLAISTDPKDIRIMQGLFEDKDVFYSGMSLDNVGFEKDSKVLGMFPVVAVPYVRAQEEYEKAIGYILYGKLAKNLKGLTPKYYNIYNIGSMYLELNNIHEQNSFFKALASLVGSSALEIENTLKGNTGAYLCYAGKTIGNSYNDEYFNGEGWAAPQDVELYADDDACSIGIDLFSIKEDYGDEEYCMDCYENYKEELDMYSWKENMGIDWSEVNPDTTRNI